MSKYRDDLDAAQNRIANLEDRLSEREAELAELKQKKEPPKPTPSGRAPVDGRLKALGMSLAIIAVSAGFVARFHATERADRARELPLLPPVAMPLAKAELPGAPHTSARMSPDVPGGEPAADIAKPRRPDDCLPKHNYFKPSYLPAGAETVTFDKCSGCNCCATAGEFPPPFLPGHAEPNPDYDECSQCSIDAALSHAGITIAGVSPSSHGSLTNNGHRVVRIALDHPVLVFGARVEPQSLRAPLIGRDDWGKVTMVGYDAQGRVADFAEVVYDATFVGGPEVLPDFPSRSRFIAVESCDGVTLSRVEMRFSDTNMIVDDLTIEPPMPR